MGVMMKFVAVFVLVAAIACNAQTDDVPKDRCGLVVASNEDERLEIFVLGHDNQIYHKYQLNDKEWSNWASLGGVYIRGGPSVIKAADGRLVLFVRSTDRAIYYKAQTSANSATWTSWQSLGGRFASSPAACPGRTGTASVAFFHRDLLCPSHQTELSSCSGVVRTRRFGTRANSMTVPISRGSAGPLWVVCRVPGPRSPHVLMVSLRCSQGDWI